MSSGQRKAAREWSKEFEVEGHLIDSMILSRIFDRIMDLGGDFEVLEFRIGKRKTDYSYAKLLVKARSEEHLKVLTKELHQLGAVPTEYEEPTLKPAPQDMVAPDGFYVTTNHPTFIYLKGRWVEVEGIEMDKVIVVSPDKERAICKKLRDLKKGNLVVVGERGVKVKPPERPREGVGVFEFMGSKTSSEKPAAAIIRSIARDIHAIKKQQGKVVVVAGPAVVHTGAAPHLAKIIAMGYVDALLTGNALAVHDIEYALYGTSLGVRVDDGQPVPGGNRNHLSAINEVYKAGSIKRMVKLGILKKGIMYECVKRGIPFVLAGSIRDDGPLPEVITDVVKAQDEYRKHLRSADLVLMLGTMLHSIAVGNMLPSTVKVVCVDINPAVVIKLMDRGTAQAVGVVSDIGAFLPLLAAELERLRGS
ncbi:MAG: TIGR00300 family protein [Candidatus Verstraetearchaeota archaeon]|nr:TIGR00300 family protein [Candidatus Verstraetearchaeota archaeon]